MTSHKSAEEIDEVPPIPGWFLDNCVKTSSELARLETRIVLRDGHPEESSTIQESKFEMLSCMYQDLLDLVSPLDVNTKETPSSNTDTTPKQSRFTNDGVILRLPGDNGTSPSFFLAIIEHFARDIGADMVKLSIQDVDALRDCLQEHQLNKRKTTIPPLEHQTLKENQKPENLNKVESNPAGQPEDDDSAKKGESADESGAEFALSDEITNGSNTPSQFDSDSSNNSNSNSNNPKTKADAISSSKDQGFPDSEPGEAFNGDSNKMKKEGDTNSKDQGPPEHKHKDKNESPDGEESDDDGRSVGSSSSSDSDPEYATPPTVAFYRQIIACLQERRMREQELAYNSRQKNPLLIIVLLEVFNFVSQSTSTLSLVRECTESLPSEHSVLLIGTDQTASSRCPPPPPPPPPQWHHLSSPSLPSPPPPRLPPPPSRDLRTLKMFSHKPVREAIEIVPLCSPSQKDLFLQEKEADTFATNIRTLQREVKNLVSIKDDALILQPYNGWKVQSGSDSEKFLKQSLLSDQRLRGIATRIAKDFPVSELDELIVQELTRVEARTKAIDKWNEGSKGNGEGLNKWSRLPPHVYKAVKQIEGDPQKFKWEIELLDNIVDPDTIEETWADIALQPKIKTYINQMVSLVVSKEKSRGILKTSHIGGALLYGPPGTGKTQLARILSKESSVVMMQVSSAEMEQKWVGETPKLIKALFNLGRMLSPCIIFIDEADSLFRARGSHDFSFDRTKSSQLLNETDGLRKSTSAPFLLLATNHPDQLDHAFLRRVPGRVYVGLPDEEARLKMLKIFLRDEELDPSINLESLAKKTENYTGSDIRVLCVQAAMILLSEEQEESSAGVDNIKKLKMSHFEDALKRTSPTVRESSMAAIRNFAKEFDPLVVKSTYLKDNPAWRDAIACGDQDEPHQNASMYL